MAKHDHSLPDSFMNHLTLSPSFYMPENDALKYATHNNIRTTLFYQIFRSIKYLEFKHVRKDEWFELKTITCSQQEGLLDKFVETYVSKEKEKGKLIDA